MPPKRDNGKNNGDHRGLRERNNEAVKKSRLKAKQRTQETFSRVSKLKAEHEGLQEKVKTLTKELQFLKELFIAHSSKSNNSSQNPTFEEYDLKRLLDDIPDDTDSNS